MQQPVLISLLVLAGIAAAAAIGECPRPDVKIDFDLEKFAGTWYSLEEKFSFTGVGTKCATYILEARENGRAGLMEKRTSKITGKETTHYYEVTTIKDGEPAKLRLSHEKGIGLEKEFPFWIIDTDYENFALGWSCKQMLLTNTQQIWILSRSRSLDNKILMGIYNKLSEASIDQKLLIDIDHKDCE